MSIPSIILFRASRRAYLLLASTCIALTACQPLPSTNLPAPAPAITLAPTPSLAVTQPGPTLTAATPAAATVPTAAATAGRVAVPVASSSPAPVPTGAAAATPTSAPTALPGPAPRPAGPIDASRPGQVTVVGTGLQEPDDLVAGPDGRIYVSDVGDGTVRRLEPDGSTSVLLAGLSEPEGMVFLPGGDLVIAEQGRNRLVLYSAAAKRLTPWLSLPNSTGQLGVDGIALDDRAPGPATLIVPDSPHGTVLRVSLLDGGKQAQIIGRGFVRPVAAWVEPAGSILVADEFGNRLARLHPDGSQETLARLPEPDDVVEDGAGHIYVNTLSDGAVHAIDGATGADRVLVRGLLSPQGIVLDAQGGLLVTDPGRHRVVRIQNP